MIDWIFRSMPLFYAVHTILSGIVAYIATLFLKRRYVDRGEYLFIFIWTFSFILPIVGYFMVVWIVYYLLNIKYEVGLKNKNIVNMEEFLSDFPRIKRAFGEAGIDKLLSNSEAPENLKLKALTSLSENAGRSDIEMIKKMLGDKNDEVRLYSFSIINKLERNINNKIHERLKHFNEEEEGESKLEMAVELAHLYWDLVYYQLSDKDLRNFIIKEVESYSRYVLHHDDSNPEINLLLGKLYLSQGKYNNAQLHIAVALQSGAERDFIIPYLAEIFYEKREFLTVKKLMRDAEDIKYNPTLYPIVKQWEERVVTTQLFYHKS